LIHRAQDPLLLKFLQLVRKEQPTRSFLQEFYKERHLHPDLATAVKQGMGLQARRGQHFMWLCVTNKGAAEINDLALIYTGVSEAQRKHGLPGDEKAGAGTMFIKENLWIRLTQNLDKPRGFVNGALAQVVSILARCDTGVTQNCQRGSGVGSSYSTGTQGFLAVLLWLCDHYSARARIKSPFGCALFRSLLSTGARVRLCRGFTIQKQCRPVFLWQDTSI